ncbi:putative transcription initiation factor IIF, alpha subunit, Zinc finger, RING/FYVE/PHD-type [Helianthus annuus]|nr:putative transcription initiation factor IIF, alpha subunit, Zinc finger, RING/FYVE/PHD-type [Helianthus annuus]
MSFNLVLNPSCDGWISMVELYGSNCKHMTICVACGKTMAERKDRCRDCAATITRLIRVCIIITFLYYIICKNSY